MSELKNKSNAQDVCPLCKTSNIAMKEQINVDDLNNAYYRMYGISNALHSTRLDYRECLHCGLRFFHPLETGTEELYETLQKYDWYYMTAKEEFNLAVKYLPEQGTVLEVGAGKAAFSQLVGASRYTGLEFNDKAITRAREQGITLLKESVEQHAATGHRYDAVVSFQVLEHVSSPASFLKGCVDCLKPGGSLVIAVPSCDGFAGEAINDTLNMPPHHVTHWSENALRSIANLFPLEVAHIEHEKLAEYHVKWARQIQIENRMRKFFGISHRLLDQRLMPRLISSMARQIARRAYTPKPSIKGHTVLAHYRKLPGH